MRAKRAKSWVERSEENQKRAVQADTEEEKKINHLLQGLKTIIMLNSEHQNCVYALSCIKYIKLDVCSLLLLSLEVCCM